MGEGIPYCGSGPLPDEIWGRWNGDPVLLGLLAAAGLLILLHPPGGVRRKACAAAAWAVLVLAFVSPLCALSSALFSARALHHLLLIAAAAPLIAAALPDAGPARRPGAGLLVATLAQTAALWLWHMPGPYAAALADGTLYWLMQATLLGSAVLFWSTLRTAAPAGAARLSALLAMVMQMGLLGALLTFVPAPLYAAHFATTLPWGLTPLEDQQLAGLVMWVPAALPYLAAALVPLAGWLAAAHRASPEPQGVTATWLKILHIAALSVWCAGLLVLPGVLVRTGRAVQTGEWEGAAAQQLRSFGRACYLAVASPAAVLAIGSGMALIFQRGAFAPWLFAKLALVGVLVLVHMQHGRSIARLAQAEGRIGRLLPALLLAAAGTAMVAILWLVLAKPGFDETLFPDWLRQPRPDRTDWDWTGQSSLASSRPI